METTEKKPVPPYVAYKTLVNFLDRFKQGVPARIDRGLMGSMSGAAQSQVTTALRYLGMISEKGFPAPALHAFVSGQESERKAVLEGALHRAYPFIFDGAFNLATATASMLREAFEAHTTATGETLGRCMTFFKDAAVDAGLEVSRYITQKKARTTSSRKKEKAKRLEKPLGHSSGQAAASVHLPPSPMVPAQSSLLLSGLFQRLPKPGTVWPKDERDRWLQTLGNVLLLEYPEK